MSKRPETTLFMLMSVDGKISTGDTDIMDVDKDFPQITGLKEGLHQYYELEQETDLFSLNTGRVFAKVGMNTLENEPEKLPVSFIVIDNQPHLNEQGVVNLSKKAEKVFLVTTNTEHPAFKLSEEYSNIIPILYEKEINFTDLMQKLAGEYGVEKLTLQSGGTLNATLLREGLIDKLQIVVAPVLVGGKDTSTLIDGESLHNKSDLLKLRPLELIQAKPLENSYLLLEYKVLN